MAARTGRRFCARPRVFIPITTNDGLKTGDARMNVHTPQSDSPEKSDAKPFLISADSHAVEPSGLWKDLPEKLRDLIPAERPRSNNPPGSSDPVARLDDQKRDGIVAEILFPHYGMGLFHLG